MKIYSKLILVFIPIVVLSILSVAVAGILPARSAITNVTKTFFTFKTETFKKEVVKQYELLVEGDVIDDPVLLDSTKKGIIDFAKSRLIEYRVVRSKKEDTVTDWLIFSWLDEGRVSFSTSENSFDISDSEGRDLVKLIENSLKQDKDGNSTDKIPFSVITLNGERRVVQGFYFAPFGETYFLTVKESAYYSIINMLFFISFFILVVFIIFSIIMTLIFSSIMTKPIINIQSSMKEIIKSGDLTKKVEIEYNDETGQLAHTFNIMIGELDKAYSQIKSYAYQAVLARDNEIKIRNIFQKYVPQELINKFFENPETMLVGDSRKVAVLFSDIRSFTTISETMKPDELVQSLNDYFTIMVDIIINRQGVVDKYIGDAIMAFFGAPVAHKDDPYQSVLTALEMAAIVKKFNKKQVKLGRPKFEIGVGVNYGEVIVGNIGTEKKMDYTVIGDSVNLASRLEGLTKEYKQEVIISEFLYDEIKEKVPCRMLDVVTVKGKTTGVRVYTPKLKLSKKEAEAWELHNHAMDCFLSKDFKEAEKLFKKVFSILPKDCPSQIMITRCKALKGKRIPRNWDGTQIMEKK